MCGLGEYVVRKSQDGDEDLGFQRHFTCSGILDRYSDAGIVDKESVSRAIEVSHGDEPSEVSNACLCAKETW